MHPGFVAHFDVDTEVRERFGGGPDDPVLTLPAQIGAQHLDEDFVPPHEPPQPLRRHHTRPDPRGPDPKRP